METRYSPAEIEKKWYAYWEEAGYFAADPESERPAFSILMPPPNLTGSLHLGHVMQHAIMDTVARYKRMRGFDVLLQPGVDHAGLQLQGVLDKKLSKDGINPRALSREEYLAKAWEFKEENYSSVKETFRQTGISADWSRELFSLDEGSRRAVFEEFKTYYEQGLVYRGPYIVQWCAKCGTAISDIEMEYEERKETLYYVKYKVAGDDFMVIATARPETIFADSGIAVHPDNARFKEFIGMEAENPLTGALMPIFADERVEAEFGTGALKITPAHDPLDYAIGKDHDLAMHQVVGKDGKLTELAGDLAGTRVAEARKVTAERLEQSGNIAKTEEYTHQVPVCERCKTVVEPLISEEWFVRMKPLAEKALEAINLGKITFLPENYTEILSRWLGDIHDWTISRSQVWGHRIPVWYKDGEQVVAYESPGEGWVQDEQVLDTWFSSSLWPMSTLGWPAETKELGRYYPWSLEVTAPEIKFLWIARMIMLGLWFKDDVPFSTMFFHGALRDLQGRKFSKSLGNGIDPLRLFEAWGVDATRMTLISYAIAGRDGRASNQTMDERAKNYRNFATKLWNVARFILQDESGVSREALAASRPEMSNEVDVAILDRLDEVRTKVERHIENYELHLALEELYNFVWHEVADEYVEQAKGRREESQVVLEYLLDQSLRMLHPFAPFVTEEIWSNLYPEKSGTYQSLMTSDWA